MCHTCRKKAPGSLSPSSRPTQSPALRFSGPIATWGQRAAAWFINAGFLVAAFFVAFILGRVWSVLGLLATLVAIVYAWYIYWQDGSSGQSPGKALTGLRVVGAVSGAPIGGGLGLARGLVQSGLGCLCGIGALVDYTWPLHDPKGQTVHDKAVGAIVIANQPKRRGADLFRP